MTLKDAYIEALLKELRLRKDYLAGEEIKTIYFGGGTPSQLQADDFRQIFDTIHSLFPVHPEVEVTIEVNPDDITASFLESLRPLPFNRISMGIQSFDPEDLQFLNRRHSSEQATLAVNLCKQYGYHNMSIDLIYGLPGQTQEGWEKNIKRAIQLDIPHISAYHLIYEEDTQLYKLKQQGKIESIEEETSISFFTTLIDNLSSAGFIHYEISNFAKPGFFSRHNSSYWTGEKYMGLGPSAHSYNGEEREWNISSLPEYIKGMAENNPKREIEHLSESTRYNDYIITGLRTMWGIDLHTIEKLFGEKYVHYCQKQVATYVRKGLVNQQENVLTLARNGIYISDSIMSDLLWV